MKNVRCHPCWTGQGRKAGLLGCLSTGKGTGTRQLRLRLVVRSLQRPSGENTSRGLLQLAERLHLPARIGELTSASEDQRLVPSALGVFGAVQEGGFLSYGYLKQPDRAQHLAGGRHGNPGS